MKPLNKEQEERLMGSLRRMVGHVNAGMGPDDALFKVSSEDQYNPHFVRRLAEVFNVSRTLAHFTQATSEKRADAFAISDADTVLQRMYPDSEAEAHQTKAAELESAFKAPPDYATIRTPTPEIPRTYASSAPPDFASVQDRVVKHSGILKHRAKIARDETTIPQRAMHGEIVKAATYFRSPDAIPFEVFEENTLSRWGTIAQPILDAVHSFSRVSLWHEKRGSMPARARLFDDTAEPYCYVGRALAHAEHLLETTKKAAQASEELESFTKLASEKLQAIREAVRLRKPSIFQSLLTKDADDLKDEGFQDAEGNLTSGGSLINSLSTVPPKDDNKELTIQWAGDPKQELRKRKIETQLMLNELMTADPVLSKIPYENIMLAYNEIARLAPRAATQPAVMRNLLRRHLMQGLTDHFEAQQLAATERVLQQTNDFQQ